MCPNPCAAHHGFLCTQVESSPPRRKALKLPLPACCAQVEHALLLHTTDNVSVITVCFRETPPARPRATMARTLSREGLSVLSAALLPVGSCLAQIPEQPREPMAVSQLSGL